MTGNSTERIGELTEQLVSTAGAIQKEVSLLEQRRGVAISGTFTRVSDRFAYVPVPTEADLQEVHVEAYRGRFGKEVQVNKPGKDVREVLLIASDLGWPIRAHFVPQLSENILRNLPKPLNSFYWENRANDSIKDIAKGGYWVGVDNSIRPPYEDGRQVFKNDFFGLIVARLRDEGNKGTGIITPSGYEKVPPHSRFAISFSEVEKFVLPAFARPLRINQRWARVPLAEESNFLGNIFEEELGHLGGSDTWEWYWNRFEGDVRLIGGDSGHGGLSYVDCGWFDRRDGGIAFRPLVEFSFRRA